MFESIKSLSLALLLISPGLSASETEELEKRGTLLRLQGDFDSAEKIQDQLIERFEAPVGHIFAMNTIVTHLTWDESITDYDPAIEQHSKQTLDWCENRLETESNHVTANYYCGQAHFMLAYYRGLRGSYYQAGRHGTRSIEYLERALKLQPNLIDAKMHLGVAYYVADNLPPFIKLFSKVLWFIPTGNSEKSLPYIREVIANGDQYPDVARYIFTTLAFEDDAILKSEAFSHLEHLVSNYPRNARFQLRLLSHLLNEKDHQRMLEVADRFISSSSPEESEYALVQIMKVRAHLELNQPGVAEELFQEINPIITGKHHRLPDWSLAWHLLADGQLRDLSDQRDIAISKYKKILSIAQSTYVSDKIIEAARTGLNQPYSLSR